MDEKELLAGLRGLTLVEPKLGFDPDELADRGAKRSRTRRAALATGVGTLVVAGMTVGILVYNNAAGSLPVVPGTPSTTTTSRAKTPKYNLGPQIERIRKHLEEKLPELLPAAKDLRVTDVEQQYPEEDEVLAVVEFRDDAGPAHFNVAVGGVQWAKNNPFSKKCFCEAPRVQPDGSKVFIEKLGGSNPNPPDYRHASHERKDGTEVYIDHSKHIPGGTRSRFPLTDDQLIALVTDPDLNLR